MGLWLGIIFAYAQHLNNKCHLPSVILRNIIPHLTTKNNQNKLCKMQYLYFVKDLQSLRSDFSSSNIENQLGYLDQYNIYFIASWKDISCVIWDLYLT